MDPVKKKIAIYVDDDIADEFKMQLENFVEDFYGEESGKIEIKDEE